MEIGELGQPGQTVKVIVVLPPGKERVLVLTHHLLMVARDAKVLPKSTTIASWTTAQVSNIP